VPSGPCFRAAGHAFSDNRWAASPAFCPREPAARIVAVRIMHVENWQRMSSRLAPAVCAFSIGCSHDDGPKLAKDSAIATELRAGEAAPIRSEVAAAGELRETIRRDARAFGRLVKGDHPKIQFKDEEGTGADRMMTVRLRTRLHRLAARVEAEWPGVNLRVTEAWDEDVEHGKRSLHYEGRAADLTTSDRDPSKLGRLAGLAVASGFDWVYFENASHVHVSVRP
jgi:hypothetical protein